jgi:hypothetical protein
MYKFKAKVSIYLLVSFFFIFRVFAQDTSKVCHLISIPNKIFHGLNKKVKSLEKNLQCKTEKYLFKLQKEEKELKNKLMEKDSALAERLFYDIDRQYTVLRNCKGADIPFNSVYSGHFDSLTTGIEYLSLHSLTNEKFNVSLTQLNDFQNQLNTSEQIRRYFLQRQQYLKEQLSQFGLSKEIIRFKKQVLYYQAQIFECRHLFEDATKFEEKLMQAVMNIPEFNNFFAENSQIGRLFRNQNSINVSNVSLVGLQSRYSSQQLMGTRAIVDPSQFAQTQLKNSNSKIGDIKQNFEPPLIIKKANNKEFKMNSQRAKTFGKRLEKGANIQFGRVNDFLPGSADLAVSIGYHLNDNGIIGLGTSFKLGLGNGIGDIYLRNQGYSLRSFIDWKLKESLYISGGYEKVYMPFATNLTIPIHNWQERGLIGLSKKYSISEKVKGNIQFLFDFLSNKYLPKKEPILFRIGYNF